MKNAALSGRPYAGNSHVWFDGGEDASAKPGRGALLHMLQGRIVCALIALAMWTVRSEEQVKGEAKGGSEPKERVAIICAHPDDLPGCAGTAFLLREKFELHVIDFTHGELGLGEAGLKDGSTKVTRTKEEERACSRLGARLHWLSNVDGSAFASEAACDELERVLVKIKPRAVITHWPIETHPDHVMATAAFFRVWRRPKLLKDFDPEVYFQDQCNQSRAFVPVHYVDISKVLDKKEDLIRCYVCQQGDAIAARKRKDCELRGWRLTQLGGGSPYAEVFAEWPRDRASSRCIFSEIGMSAK